MTKELTQSRLKEMLHYEPTTGVFIWLEPVARRIKQGDEAGTLKSGRYPYRQITVFGKRYLSRRLAWFYVHGVWPANDIGSNDGDTLNAAISNLSEVTHSVNLHRSNRPRGVFSCHGKYAARITIGGKLHYLGTYSSKEEAQAAYIEAKLKYNPDHRST